MCSCEVRTDFFIYYAKESLYRVIRVRLWIYIFCKTCASENLFTQAATVLSTNSYAQGIVPFVSKIMRR
jgi:hypothetical protein